MKPTRRTRPTRPLSDHNRFFWFNHVTNESSWDPPVDKKTGKPIPYEVEEDGSEDESESEDELEAEGELEAEVKADKEKADADKKASDGNKVAEAAQEAEAAMIVEDSDWIRTFNKGR